MDDARGSPVVEQDRVEPTGADRSLTVTTRPATSQPASQPQGRPSSRSLRGTTSAFPARVDEAPSIDAVATANRKRRPCRRL